MRDVQYLEIIWKNGRAREASNVGPDLADGRHAAGLLADRILAEVNKSEAMVEGTIRAVDSRVSYKSAHDSRGKVVRAEPTAAIAVAPATHRIGWKHWLGH